MNVRIEQLNNGFVVYYEESDKRANSTYVYMATQDLIMLEKIAEKFIKRKIKIVEQ